MSETIHAPARGKIFSLGQVNDPVFSSEKLGKGIAINPVDGEVVSPVDGKVVSLFPARHAITLLSDQGAEVLIHIGIDTVQLDGKHFSAFVNNGDTVKKGDKLIEFDLQAVINEGFDPVIIVVVTNSKDYKEIKTVNMPDAGAGDTIINLL